MNSLDALAAAAKEGAGIGRVPWQLEADLAAGHLARLRTDCEPAPAPLHPMFQPPRLTSPRIRAFVDDSSSAGAASIRLAHGPRQPINRINIQFLGLAKWPWYTKPLSNLVSIAS